MMSVTSSVTLGIVENSCRTPSILTDEMAAPGIDEYSTRRREFPTVYPNPGSSGSIMNLERVGETTSSLISGLATTNIPLPSAGDHPLLPRRRTGSLPGRRPAHV